MSIEQQRRDAGILTLITLSETGECLTLRFKQGEEYKRIRVQMGQRALSGRLAFEEKDGALSLALHMGEFVEAKERSNTDKAATQALIDTLTAVETNDEPPPPGVDGALDAAPVPEPVKEEVKEEVAEEVSEPEPVKEEVPELEPVKEEVSEPEPVKEEVPEPEPVKEEVPEPEPVKEEVKEETEESTDGAPARDRGRKRR